MQLFDTHCHLDDSRFAADAAQVIARARDSGVVGIVTVGTSLQSTRAAISIARAHPGLVWASAGIHPNEAEPEPDESAFAALAREKEVVAIGETGLDYYRDHARPARQKAVLSMHFRAAQETSKPLIVHCRDAHDSLYEQLAAEMRPPVRGVMHCFSGSLEQASKFMDLGLYISIAGPVTFPNAGRLRDVVRALPLDRLVVETDAPYLAPQEFRGKRNEPSYVRFTANTVAALLGKDVESVCATLARNGRKLFGLG